MQRLTVFIHVDTQVLTTTSHIHCVTKKRADFGDLYFEVA